MVFTSYIQLNKFIAENIEDSVRSAIFISKYRSSHKAYQKIMYYFCNGGLLSYDMRNRIITKVKMDDGVNPEFIEIYNTLKGE